MRGHSFVSSNNSEEKPSQKVVKEDFWPRKKKSENPFGGGRTKQQRNHTSYLRAKAQCPNEIVEIDGCRNALVCNDDSLLEFRGFDADDEYASQIRLQSIGGHVFQITDVAPLGANDTIFYAPTSWCTSTTEEWIVNQLGLTIIADSEENGRIRIMRGYTRLMTGFWYEGRVSAFGSLNSLT